MIDSKKKLKKVLQKEKERYGKKTGILYYLTYSERAMIWHFQKRLRLTEYYLNTNKRIRKVISKILLHRQQIKLGLNIEPNVFDEGLKIMHIGSILTNSRVRVGKNCTVHINVSIVARGNDDTVPIIGDNVTFGVGATVLGGIKLANGIVVGANALVNKSFDEENIAIAGCPAKKISNNGDNTWHGRRG